jgi:hypothetical protein
MWMRLWRSPSPARSCVLSWFYVNETNLRLIAMRNPPTIGIPFYCGTPSMILNASVLYKDRIYMIAGAWQAKLNKIISQRGEFNLWCNI